MPLCLDKTKAVPVVLRADENEPDPVVFMVRPASVRDMARIEPLLDTPPPAPEYKTGYEYAMRLVQELRGMLVEIKSKEKFELEDMHYTDVRELLSACCFRAPALTPKEKKGPAS